MKHRLLRHARPDEAPKMSTAQSTHLVTWLTVLSAIHRWVSIDRDLNEKSLHVHFNPEINKATFLDLLKAQFFCFLWLP